MKDEKSRIGIIYDPKKPETKKCALEAVNWLKERERESRVYTRLNTEIMKELKLVVTVGGDGLVLHTANKVAPYNIPLLRVNFGHIGYLTNVEPREIFRALEEVLSGNFYLKERTRIEAEVFHGAELTKRVDALNEIVFGGINRMVSLKIEARVGDGFSAEVKGDGIILSTQTGSTAYNVNAGGPVLLADVVSVVANNAYFKSDFLLFNTKAFIVPVEANLKIEVINQNKQNLPYIIADGQRNYRLKSGDFVTIKKSSAKTLFMEVARNV